MRLSSSLCQATRCLLTSLKVPFIFCMAAPHRVRAPMRSSCTTKTLLSDTTKLIKEFEYVTKKLGSCHAQSSSTRRDCAFAGNASKSSRIEFSAKREVKKLGFSALTRWCCTRQDAAALSAWQKAVVANKQECITALETLDAAAIAWVQRFMTMFSCGQGLAVLSCLCDSLHNMACASFSVGGLTQKEETLASAPGAISAYSLINTIISITQRVVASKHLENQPLPLLLSATYALHRLTTKASPVRNQLTAVARTALEPPPVFFFAVLHQMRLALANAASTRTEQHDSDSDDLGVEVLLTFVLVMGVERRAEIFTEADFGTLRTVVNLLCQRIGPQLKTNEEMRQCINQKRLLRDEKEHGRRSEDLLAHVLSETDQEALPAESAAARSVLLSECIEVMQSARFAKPFQRMGLLQYLCCVMSRPSGFSRESIALLTQLFQCIGDITPVQRHLLTDFIIQQLPSLGVAETARLLPYTRDPLALLGNIELTDATVRGLQQIETVNLVRVAGLLLPWKVHKKLIFLSLAKYPTILEALQQAEKGAVEPEVWCSAIGTQCPLTPDYTILLSSLVLERVPHSKPPLGDPSIHDEAQRLAAVLVESVNWSAGVVTGEPQEGADDGTCSGVQILGPLEEHMGTFRFSLLALRVYLEYHEKYMALQRGHPDQGGASDASSFSTAAVVDDKKLLSLYAHKIFSADRHHKLTETIPVLVRLLDHLKEEACKRQLMERLIRYNGTDSVTSLFRFIELFSHKAMALSMYNKDLTRLLLKQRHLDPRRLRSVVFGFHPGDKQHSKVYTVYLLQALTYVLGSTQGKAQSCTEKIGQAVTSWIDHYFRVLKNERSEVQKIHKASSAVTQEVVTVGVSDEATQKPLVVAPVAASVNGTIHDDVPSGQPIKSDSEIGVDDLSDDEDGDEEESAMPHSAALCLLSCPSKDLTVPIKEADMEELLTLIHRVGCKLPDSMLLEVGFRCQAKAIAWTSGAVIGQDETAALPSTRKNPTKVGMICNGEVATSSSTECRGPLAERLGGGEERYYVPQIPRVDVEAEGGPSPRLDSWLAPAHFVALVRIDRSVPLPLHRSYLRFLLESCDLRIADHVFSAFIMAARGRRPLPVLCDDVDIIKTAVEVLLGRVEEVRSGAGDGMSNALFICAPLAHLARIAISQLVSTPHYAKAVAEVMQAGRDGAAGEITTKREIEAGNTSVAKGMLEASILGKEGAMEGVAAPVHLLEQLHAIENALLRIFSILDAKSVKDMAPHYHCLLHPIFPRSSAFFFARVSEQLESLSQKELLFLASSYPPSADVVLRHLQKVDLRLTVDFNEFLKMAGFLPMRMIVAVVEAHLGVLSVSWCIRLLSALAPRQEEIPMALLAKTLERILQENEAIRYSDQTLLLSILRCYLPATCHGACVVSRPPEHLSCERAQAPMTLEKAEDRQRKQLILNFIAKVLSLGSITTVESLASFWASFPSSFQSMAGVIIVRQVERVILKDMMHCDAVDAVKLSALLRFLHRHRLLLQRTTLIIKEGVFSSENLSKIIFARSSEGAPSPRDGNDSVVLSRARQILCAELGHVVEIAVLFGVARCGSKQHRAASSAAQQDACSALKLLQEHLYHPSERLVMLTSLVDAMTRHDLFSLAHLDLFSEDCCEALLLKADKLAPSELARLFQNISKLKKWHLVKRGKLAEENDAFDRVFRATYLRSDAHSRCVVVKALSSDPEIFAKYEAYTMNILHQEVHLLSHEDLELLLVACLRMQNRAAVEETLDTIGTRLLSMLEQCRRSTLVRLLQCHATFSIADDHLLTRVLGLLEEQCVSRGEVKLDCAQVLTLLQAVVQLDLPVPERLTVLCFNSLEKNVDRLSNHQLALVGQVAMDLEMGYTPSVHVLVTRILESKEAYRVNKQFRQVTERLCDEYDVEAPTVLRGIKLRMRRERERLEEYWNHRHLLAEG